MPRYVVLRHETPLDHVRPLHWDLMLEAEGGLWTWALPAEPRLQQTLVAERLADHRTAYLDYEGPISRDRGEVRRIMQGDFAYQQVSDDCIELQVESGDLPARVRFLRQADGQCWNVTFEEDK